MTTPTTVAVAPIPKEIVDLIPLYNGDKRQLNLYLRKCQYVVDRFKGNTEQNLYVFNVLTSRLKEDAAALLSEREDIVTWSAFKDLLIQHFGDPRSEACINIELESLKINSSESFLDFCNRIQNVRSLLMSKVNTIDDVELKRAKSVIYNNTALNVFLYNLPENMVRIVRLKSPTTLEAALSIVLEEVNFLDQYNMRNRIHSNNQISGSSSKSSITQPVGYKPFQSKFNLNNPQNTQNKIPQTLGQGQPFKPVFEYRPQLGLQPQQFGYRPAQQSGYRPPVQFGYRPPLQFGYRPPQQFGYRPPQPFGYRPPLQLGYKLPQQLGYKPPQPGSNLPQVLKPQNQDSDVSMRTAQPKQQQGFNLNELTMHDYEYVYGPYWDEFNYYNPSNDYDYLNDINYYYDNVNNDTNDCNIPDDKLEATNDSQNVNFQEKASMEDKKS